MIYNGTLHGWFIIVYLYYFQPIAQSAEKLIAYRSGSFGGFGSRSRTTSLRRDDGHNISDPYIFNIGDVHRKLIHAHKPDDWCSLSVDFNLAVSAGQTSRNTVSIAHRKYRNNAIPLCSELPAVADSFAARNTPYQRNPCFELQYRAKLKRVLFIRGNAAADSIQRNSRPDIIAFQFRVIQQPVAALNMNLSRIYSVAFQYA